MKLLSNSSLYFGLELGILDSSVEFYQNAAIRYNLSDINVTRFKKKTDFDYDDCVSKFEIIWLFNLVGEYINSRVLHTVVSLLYKRNLL